MVAETKLLNHINLIKVNSANHDIKQKIVAATAQLRACFNIVAELPSGDQEANWVHLVGANRTKFGFILALVHPFMRICPLFTPLLIAVIFKKLLKSCKDTFLNPRLLAIVLWPVSPIFLGESR